MWSLKQGALLKKLAIGLSVTAGALISPPPVAQSRQVIAWVEPMFAEVEPRLETTPTTQVDEEMIADGDIVDVAASNGPFETLITALETAGLVDTLSGEGPYTVFAPTDEAFAALPEGSLEKLLMPENQATLAQILTYHVVPAALTSEDLVSGSLTTVEGSDIRVEIEGAVKVNDATVITPDITASNGIIHAIDKVITPSVVFAELMDSKAIR